ncbi:MAG TPA: hypothetical protein VNN10_16100 [Dehalococcoidia bacterium]|nr:hypothetical protein [Dehalococcoidia bacterium]
MVAGPFLVLFCGGLGGTPVEELQAGALRECALDTLDEALATGAYEGAVVVADAASADALGPRLPPGVVLDRDAPGQEFHFGRRLTEVVLRYGLERPVYVGCGMPLLKGDELAAVASALESQDLAVVSNNFFSADLVGFVPGDVVRDVELPDNDRILPRFLVQEAGLINQALPRTIANQFDIDTPIELSILAYAGGAGPRLTAWLAAHPVETERIAKAAWLFTDNQAVVLVAGRIGGDTMEYLRNETASQTRVYSEERGMQAAGRDISGEARSLLGFHIQAVGITRFFAELGQLANGAFIDTRPVFAHMGLRPSRPDRFLSDALQPEGIADPWLREFTAAAREAPIPVVLGGQSLVTSGLQLLAEAAWKRHDLLEAEYKARGRARERG